LLASFFFAVLNLLGDIMNKIAIFLTLLVGASFVSVKVMDVDLDDPISSWDEERKIQERVTNYACFKQTLYATIDELKEGQIPLKKAHARIMTAARRYHPDFFVFLIESESGKSDEERVAKNLFEHVDSRAEFHPHLAPRVAALRLELQELLAEFRNKQ
jgi:hypothetical protein